LPVHEERRISAEQPQPTAAHHTITTARRPDHISLSALVRSRSTQFIVHGSSQLGRGPLKPGHFLPFWRGFYVAVSSGCIFKKKFIMKKLQFIDRFIQGSCQDGKQSRTSLKKSV